MNRIGDTLIHLESNKEIILAFNTYKVEFLLIGGLAISWYCPERRANDMDLLVNPTPENSEKIFHSLFRINRSIPDKMSFARKNIQVHLKEYYYADIITPDNSLNFYELSENASPIKIYNIPVKIPSLSDLIKIAIHMLDVDENNREKREADIKLLKNTTYK